MEEILKILLVDDDAVDRMAVCRSLRNAGVQAEVVETETCASAIALLQQQAFDGVLLDYRLPDGNGLLLVNRAKDLGITVPLIVLTGQGDEQVAVELMKAGAADYLSKNKLAPGALVRSLFHAVRIHRAEVQATEATQRLRESEERYRLVVEGSNDGIWDWYICQNEVFCNDRLFDIIGITRDSLGTAYEAFYRLIHPNDRPRVLKAITAHLERGTPFDTEFRLLHASGSYRYCTSRGKAQRDEQGNLFRMSGIVSDITARKQAEEEVAKLNRDLERRVDELQTLFDVIPIGIAIANDPECREIRVNPTYAEMLGVAPETNVSFTAAVDRLPFQLFRGGQPLQPKDLPMQAAATSGESVLGVEVDILREDSTTVNVIGYTTPLFDERNRPRGCVGAYLNITERKRAEATQRFLADASSVLSTSLEYQTILDNIVRLAVPTLADCCFFDGMVNPNEFRLVAWQHADPAKQGWVNRARHYTPRPEQTNHPVVQSLARNAAVVVSAVTDEWVEAMATSPDHSQFLHDLDMGSVMTVPLIAHDRKLGALTFCHARSSGRHYTSADAQVAVDLAQRAALAIDNAQLYQSTQEAEHNLRRALIILGQHQQQLRTLQQLTDLLNQRLTNLPELLQLMVDAICEVIPNAEVGLIVLQNPYTGLLELTTATGVGVERFQIDTAFPPGEGLLGEIFVTGGSRCLIQKTDQTYGFGRDHVWERDTENLPDYGSDRFLDAQTLNHLSGARSDRTTPTTPPSFCAVAIESARAGRLGVLAIGSWTDPAAFNDENLQLLVAFGEQAAIALTNAQLISDLEEREERLEVQNRILGEQNQALEQQRQQIQLQNIRLQEAAKLKSQFMATMSHELRTPMNAIIGFSQLLLRQNRLNAQQRDMLDRILSNGRNLLALINDILDVSKIEAGRLELALEDVNLVQLIRVTVAELRSLVEQKRLALHLQINLENPWVTNDSIRLRQVVVNLLSNAIKFTESGSVCVTLNETASDRVILIVQDTGIGIAEAQLEHIFEAFHQLDQSLAKRFPGTGLGLAITDLLVRKMNGTITVESELGVGSTFRVEFPRRVEVQQEM